MSIIPAKQENILVLRTKGKYRKEVKRQYSKKYHQRSKDETVFSVVKRVMGDEVRPIKAKAQNNEMKLKIISYNAARIIPWPLLCSWGFYRAQNGGLLNN